MNILFFQKNRKFPKSRTCESGQGWRCDNGECLPSEWVCDGDKQCQYLDTNKPDNSDEEEGCNLFPSKVKKFLGLFLGRHYFYDF